MFLDLCLRFTWTLTLTPVDWRSNEETVVMPLLALLEL